MPKNHVREHRSSVAIGLPAFFASFKRQVNRSKAHGHDREHHQVVCQHKPSFGVGNVGSEICRWDDQEDPRINPRGQLRWFLHSSFGSRPVSLLFCNLRNGRVRDARVGWGRVEAGLVGRTGALGVGHGVVDFYDYALGAVLAEAVQITRTD